MDLRLNGADFLGTGASAGIGEATVRILAAGGVVVGIARHRQAARHGRMDGLVNNVGGLEARRSPSRCP